MFQLNLGLENKNVIITAASKGIGKAIAKIFVEEGSNIAICARNKDDLEETKSELLKLTDKMVIANQCNLTKTASIDNFFDFIIDYFKRIDILINNAGGPPSGKFDDFNINDWKNAYNLNLNSTIYMCKKVIPIMKSNKCGRIINMTSVSVKQPLNNLILSNVMRAGVIGLTKSLANELAPYNILVNSVCPGYTFTERVRSLSENIAKKNNVKIQDIIDQWQSTIPLGRLAKPEEIANVVVFLASEKASYITGTTIQVDGGFVKSLL